MWRFLPVGDPTVDIFVSRDLDSLATRRERDAVTEWESYNKTFHVMRDSQWHETQILAGLWGAKNSLMNPSLGKRLRTQMIEVLSINKKKLIKEMERKCFVIAGCKIRCRKDCRSVDSKETTVPPVFQRLFSS